jgi:hypothetical protein
VVPCLSEATQAVNYNPKLTLVRGTSSVSDFVLHAAKQNGCAILEEIIRCWPFPRIFRLPPIKFPVFGDQTLLLSSDTAPGGDFRPF